ncbi:hypothetical protein FisN_4Lh219 [Fistulifera solaris]|uniref:Uncharacterized protein n=1 Tax=Fistulifera solaris TaxID=1519565 RepID=A0A1Z5JYV9_FISSO|nr:hypothetical protein FisN_4Lh219 [Fistulifera solaris]|eukprot:GAX19194.1 hypothetical protein FisN_4Lh219 [Fistulifera solaris]
MRLLLLAGCTAALWLTNYIATSLTILPLPPLTHSSSLLFPASSSRTATASPLQQGISTWIAATPAPPSSADIQLLRQAFAEFYGMNRDLPKSLELLNAVIERWQGQAPEEVAGLYRVRGDCHFALADASAAAADYDQAVQLIQKSNGQDELAVALLGRARANKSMLRPGDSKTAMNIAKDYQLGLQLTGRQEDWDTDEELILDGIRRNPYAAWEWALVLRVAEDYNKAAEIHQLAAEAFDEIGDKAHSSISWVDAALDTSNSNLLKTVLAVKFDKGVVEGRDSEMVQRVLAKESEANMALAALYWSAGERSPAEEQLQNACSRLGKVQQVLSKVNNAKEKEDEALRLAYSIDDHPVLLDCSEYRNDDLLKTKLDWPESLRTKMGQLQKVR